MIHPPGPPAPPAERRRNRLIQDRRCARVPRRVPRHRREFTVDDLHDGVLRRIAVCRHDLPREIGKLRIDHVRRIERHSQNLSRARVTSWHRSIGAAPARSSGCPVARGRCLRQRDDFGGSTAVLSARDMELQLFAGCEPTSCLASSYVDPVAPTKAFRARLDQSRGSNRSLSQSPVRLNPSTVPVMASG